MNAPEAAWPLASASAASVSMPSADSVVAPASRGCADAIAYSSVPSASNSCQRLIVAREQALDAFGERQRRSGRFGCYDEDGRRLVGERDTRTGANEHAGEAGAEAAQTLKPGLAAVRQSLPRGARSGPRLDFRRRTEVRRRSPRSTRRTRPPRWRSSTAAAMHRQTTAMPALRSLRGPQVAGRAARRTLTHASAYDRPVA